MAREKYKTLTEQMFYVLLSLKRECCGSDIMDEVKQRTAGKIVLGPGTLYALLGDFEKQDIIRETAVAGRKRSYIITDIGLAMLDEEVQRLKRLVQDYDVYSNL